jgi:hypothetical protein
MKVLVTSYSQTGNTRRIAEAIYSVISCEKEIMPLDRVTGLDGYDLSFIGFPMLQFGPPEEARDFLERHCTGRNVALFVTHASWDAPQLKALLDSWLEKCKAPAAGSNLVGFYHCRGELSAAAAEAFMNSAIPSIRMFGSLRPMTLGHPDESEINGAKTFAVKIIEKVINP